MRVILFQAEDGIRDLVRSRGLGDVYKRQDCCWRRQCSNNWCRDILNIDGLRGGWNIIASICRCLLYTSDAADERSSVDLGGRRIIKKKKTDEHDKGDMR